MNRTVRRRSAALLLAFSVCVTLAAVAVGGPPAGASTGGEDVSSVQSKAYCGSTASSPWAIAGGPWGAHSNWANKQRPYVQPILGRCIPAAPAPLGGLDNADFDHDGIPNIDDNCLLVPNPDQQPAAKAGAAIGPADMLSYSTTWKAAHPDARFRDDSELGEACSGYNQNYLKTTKAFIEMTDADKIEVFKFLGAAGPSLGGSTDPLSSDLAVGKGNMVTSLPMCSDFNKYYQFMQWFWLGKVSDTTYHPQMSTGIFDCGKSQLLRLLQTTAMTSWFWAGKHVYTNADGGRITNRFVPGLTELPSFDSLAKLTTQLPVLSQLRLFPYGTGQSRHGYLFQGKSYLDGRTAWVMDWRGFEASFPLYFAIPHVGAMLIYDECRAIQTGVYGCMAIIDAVKGDSRYTFQEGYMPWVVKGPPTPQQYAAAIK